MKWDLMLVNAISRNGGFTGFCQYCLNASEGMIMMMNCFCRMVDRRKAFSLLSSRHYCQRSSPSRFSDTPRGGFEPAHNLHSNLIKWACTLVITTIPQHHNIILMLFTDVILIYLQSAKHDYFSFVSNLLVKLTASAYTDWNCSLAFSRVS